MRGLSPTTVGGSVQSAGVAALGAATDAALLAVNDLNEAVGWSCTDAANTIVHAVSYQPSTGMIDLNSTAEVVNLGGWTLTEATAVSSNGHYIVGYGTNPSGQTNAFELRAVLPGDANLDGKVDINDLTIVLAHYGQTGMTWAQGEFTGDGTVDINDLTIVLAHYGQSLGSSAGGMAAVPEPGPVAILWSGLVFFSYRRSFSRRSTSMRPRKTIALCLLALAFAAARPARAAHYVITDLGRTRRRDQ